jgi:hypothetical protein
VRFLVTAFDIVVYLPRAGGDKFNFTPPGFALSGFGFDGLDGFQFL